MLAIIAVVLIAIVALAVLSFAAHVLFSPWLLLPHRHRGLDQVRPATLPPVAWLRGCERLTPCRMAAGATTSRPARSGYLATVWSTTPPSE
jgi:hypothetical protein